MLLPNRSYSECHSANCDVRILRSVASATILRDSGRSNAGHIPAVTHKAIALLMARPPRRYGRRPGQRPDRSRPWAARRDGRSRGAHGRLSRRRRQGRSARRRRRGVVRQHDLEPHRPRQIDRIRTCWSDREGGSYRGLGRRPAPHPVADQQPAEAGDDSAAHAEEVVCMQAARSPMCCMRPARHTRGSSISADLTQISYATRRPSEIRGVGVWRSTPVNFRDSFMCSPIASRRSRRRVADGSCPLVQSGA